VKNVSLFVTTFKDLYVFWALFLEKSSPIVIPQAAHQALDMCFHVGLLRFTPPLCDYFRSPSTWDLQFSSASQLGASTRKWGSWFRLEEVEPSFKEFVASPVMMCL
jgi:hypothetical protein